MPTCKLTKKNSFTNPPSCILPSSSKNASRLLLPKSLWNCSRTTSFRKYNRIICNLHVQLRFLYVKFLHVEYAIGRSLEYSFCQINWNSFVFCNVKVTRTFFFLFWVLICTFYKNLIVIHHGDNNFLFYFDICIKLTLSLIISTTKKWQSFTWCVLFYDKSMFKSKKNNKKHIPS